MSTHPATPLLIQGASEGFALLAADAGPTKPRRFSMTAYTGGTMRPGGFGGTPVVVDLAGVKVPRQDLPILRDHDPGRIVGHTTGVRVGTTVELTGVLSGTGPDAREVAELAANGYPWQASIGAGMERVEFVDKGLSVRVNGQTFSGPVYVVRASELRETSFVALGADGATSATVAARLAAGVSNTGLSASELAAAFAELRLTASDLQNQYFRASVHEAAHAVVAYRRGIRLAGVGLTPADPLGFGMCRLSSPPVDSVGGLLDLMAVAAAGPVADAKTGGAMVGHDGDNAAIAAALKGVQRMIPGFQAAQVDPERAARTDLSRPEAWGAVMVLAGAIRDRRWLDGAEAEAIIAAALVDRYATNVYARFAPAP